MVIRPDKEKDTPTGGGRLRLSLVCGDDLDFSTGLEAGQVKFTYFKLKISGRVNFVKISNAA